MATKNKKSVTINGIQFDAELTEDRDYEATVPEYSVEEGYSVSDNIALGAEKLSMTLFVSDTPLKSSGRKGVSEEVAKELEDLYYERKTCKIKTKDKQWSDMCITQLTISKNQDAGMGREVKVSFVKVRKTKAKTAEVPAAYGKSGGTQAAAGTASTSSETTAAATEGPRKSMAYSLAEGMGWI